ncbi:hypothetical protein WUBG_00406 [Wuchereria bancrofti]|uniref:Uncharacterized protein n=1 Tax=Wuchereria bancrofti TaxID=6293 RepID=J9F1B8_WUCBA|nr:hypothetical protein WUBG_00406 [Wuchereria bancrofti]
MEGNRNFRRKNNSWCYHSYISIENGNLTPRTRSSSSNSRSSSSGSGNYCHSPATMDSITPRSVAYIHGRPTGIIMQLRRFARSLVITHQLKNRKEYSLSPTVIHIAS